MRLYSLIFVVLLLPATSCVETKSNESADFVFTNAKVYTVNPEQPWAEAVAVKGTDILFVGGSKEAEAYIGDQTKVTDMGGKVMLPGFVSTHEHGSMVMALSSGLMMEFDPNAEKMLNEVKKYVTENPDAPAFSFGGAYEGTVEIYKEDLDAIVSDKPFLMIAASGHGGWCNSKALEAAGITKDSEDPIDYFGRNDDGSPNGYVGSSAAVFYMMDKLQVIQKESMMDNADEVFDYMASYGITTSWEVAMIPGVEEIAFSALGELDKQGKMGVRIYHATMIQRARHIESALAALRKYGPMYNSETFNVNTLKVHGDGAFEGRTAGLLEPYSDDPSTSGLVSITQEEATYAMMEAAKDGYLIHTHSIGDRTNRVMLNAMESVREAGYDQVRITMGHSCLVHPDDVPRFKALDITANTYAALGAVYNEDIMARLGEERAALQHPLKSFIDLGVRIALSADFPTTPLNPFEHMYSAMTRQALGSDIALPPARERITLEEALKAYTFDGAYALDAETFIGSIEVGKRADLIVIDTDIFEATPEEIASTKVLATMMNGKEVYLSEEAIKMLEDFDEFEEFEFHD